MKLLLATLVTAVGCVACALVGVAVIRYTPLLAVFAQRTNAVTSSPSNAPSLLTPTCGDSNYFKQTSAILDRWNDTLIRASSTPRIALSSVIGDMQQIKRDYANLSHPDCANKLQQLISSSMRDEIDGYLLFLQQAGATSVQDQLKRADSEMNDALVEMKRIGGSQFTPLPTPTQVPETFYDVEYYVVSPGGVSLTYNNENGDSEQIETEQSEWHKSFKAKSGTFLYVSGQTKGYGVGCLIGVNGKTFKESKSQGQYTIATCSGRLP